MMKDLKLSAFSQDPFWWRQPSLSLPRTTCLSKRWLKITYEQWFKLHWIKLHCRLKRSSVFPYTHEWRFNQFLSFIHYNLLQTIFPTRNPSITILSAFFIRISNSSLIKLVPEYSFLLQFSVLIFNTLYNKWGYKTNSRCRANINS